MFYVNNVKSDFWIKLELELLYPLKTVAFGSFEGKWTGYFLNKRLSNFKIDEQGVGVSDWKILLLGCDDTKKSE